MNRELILPAGYLLDWLIGDPESMPHPVRAIGATIQSAEKKVRQIGSGKSFDLVAGGAIALGIVGTTLLGAQTVLRVAYERHRILGAALEIWMASTCLATRNLLDEAMHVIRALEDGDLDLARQRVARIVGRDTAHLSEAEVARAVIETLAESLCDGIVAPLFYLAIGGVPLALAYKATNTLDSMIGHRSEEYLYFGRVAARLDDAANWIPARLAAALLCGAAGLLPGESDLREAWRIWMRDGDKHCSPNAGQVESAMAGALRVRLGGTNSYGGEVVASPRFGEEFPPPTKRHTRKALQLTAAASILGFAVAVLVRAKVRNA